MHSFRKGEVSSAQLIGLVLAIAGFLVLLALVYGFNKEVALDDDVCKLSVIGRATGQGAIQGAGANIPLKCTTKKICLTAGGSGKCSQFAGEKDVQKIKVESVTDIEAVSAQALYSCWNMMGQGKLDLFGSFGEKLWSSATPTCVICSRVALEDGIENKIDLSKIDVNRYMQKNTIPDGTKTYAEAFTDVGIVVPKAENRPIEQSNTQFSVSSTNKNQLAFVFMQIRSTSFVDKLSNQAELGAVALGSSFFLSPSKTVGVIGFFTNTPVGVVLTGVGTLTSVAITGAGAYESQKAVAGSCGELTTTDSNKRSGCSIVQAMPYDAPSIIKLCNQIEGNP